MSGLNRKYLQLADLRRLKNFAFVSRRPVEGLFAGRHATPQKGQSVEFRDYRQYLPGDDLGSVDWKVYGRTDRLVVKVYEHQASMTVNLLVDASSSMAYRGLACQGDSKYDQACRLAAAIAFLIANQQDQVSFAFAQDGLESFQRPTSSIARMMGFLELMERMIPAAQASLASAIHDLAAASPRRSLFVIISDLLDNQADILKALAGCTHRGGEAIVFHVMHQEEIQLPDLEHGIFIDSETGGRIRLNLDDIRDAYGKRMRQFLETWRRVCRGQGVDYQLVSTATPYHRALERYLFHRAAMK